MICPECLSVNFFAYHTTITCEAPTIENFDLQFGIVDSMPGKYIGSGCKDCQFSTNISPDRLVVIVEPRLNAIYMTKEFYDLLEYPLDEFLQNVESLVKYR